MDTLSDGYGVLCPFLDDPWTAIVTWSSGDTLSEGMGYHTVHSTIGRGEDNFLDSLASGYSSHPGKMVQG